MASAHVTIARELHERKVAREHRAPNEIDVLAGCTCLRQVDIKLDQVRESACDLFFRDGRIACATDRRFFVHLTNAHKRIRADQLPFAVEVGGDHDRVGLLR